MTPKNRSQPQFFVSLQGRPQNVRCCRVASIPGTAWHALEERERPNPAPHGWAAICHLECDPGASVDICIEGLNEPLTEVTVRPLRQGITPTISGNRFTFDLPLRGHLVIEPNGSIDAPLFLFVSPVPHEIPEPEEVTRYFGPGEHLIGVTAVSSHERIYLHREAVVRGHFVGDEVSDVRIFGHGTVDAGRSPGVTDPTPRVNEYGQHRPLISFRDSTDIRIEGVHLIDSPAWSCQLFNCSHVHLEDLRIVTWRENGDGIDVVNGEHILVENCFLRTWDDALCVKSQLSRRGDHALLWSAIGLHEPSGPKWNWEALQQLETYRTHNVRFRNCVIWLDRAHALEIGFETTGREISKICFEDIDIVHDFHYAPMDISLSDRAEICDVVFRRIAIEDSRAPYIANLHVGDTYCSIDRWLGLDFGRIRGVIFEKISVHAELLPPVKIHARPLLAPRVPTEFTPLCHGLEKLNNRELPPRLIERRMDARRNGEVLIEAVEFRDWILHSSAGAAAVEPEVRFTSESEYYCGDISGHGAADVPISVKALAVASR